jgi:hypothetical protein
MYLARENASHFKPKTRLHLQTEPNTGCQNKSSFYNSQKVLIQNMGEFSDPHEKLVDSLRKEIL